MSRSSDEERDGARRVTGRAGTLAAIAILAGLALALCTGRPAAAWTVDGNAPSSDFQAFNQRFGSDAYFYPRHGAAPLGLVGFDVFVDASYDKSFGSQSFTETTIDGGLTGGGCPVGRVGVRKGLPGGFDLGVAYGQALDGDVKLVSAELQYALSNGGTVAPAVGIRLTGTRTLDAHAYNLDQYGLEILRLEGLPRPHPLRRRRHRPQQRPSATATSAASRRPTPAASPTPGSPSTCCSPRSTSRWRRRDVVQASVRVGLRFLNHLGPPRRPR